MAGSIASLRGPDDDSRTTTDRLSGIEDGGLLASNVLIGIDIAAICLSICLSHMYYIYVLDAREMFQMLFVFLVGSETGGFLVGTVAFGCCLSLAEI